MTGTMKCSLRTKWKIVLIELFSNLSKRHVDREQDVRFGCDRMILIDHIFVVILKAACSREVGQL